MLRERLLGWGARLSFAALLFVFSELIVWQNLPEFTLLDWLGLIVLYLAFAALALDIIASFKVGDPLALLLVAGIYGLVNATLINHVTAQDLPLSLIVRPLGAQPLAFLGAFASFRILSSGRATGPLAFGIALVAGAMWGIWLHWFPVTSNTSIPTIRIIPAMLATGGALIGCWLLRLILPTPAIYRHDDWHLFSMERIACGSVVAAALIIGAARDVISAAAVVLTVTLVGFLVCVLIIARPKHRKTSYLSAITPTRRPNPAAWLILIVPFLLMGWVGYSLPGSGDKSTQSTILFAALTAFGMIWPAAVSGIIGTRMLIQLAREGK